MWKRLPLLLALPLLLVACDAQPPLVPATDALHNRQGLFRVSPSMFPFYTRTELDPEGNFGYRTEEWAAIVFYRDPGCVARGSDDPPFQLFEFLDADWIEVAPDVWIPIPRDRLFACPPTVDGFSLHVEPDGVTPPKQSNLHGNAVPIWFVPWSELAPAVAAGSLTMEQLEAMPGLLRGVATQFREILHSIEFHPAPKINLTARGFILPEYGGGTFRYHVNWSGLVVGDIRNVQIVIQQ